MFVCIWYWKFNSWHFIKSWNWTRRKRVTGIMFQLWVRAQHTRLSLGDKRFNNCCCFFPISFEFLLAVQSMMEKNLIIIIIGIWIRDRTNDGCSILNINEKKKLHIKAGKWRNLTIFFNLTNHELNQNHKPIGSFQNDETCVIIPSRHRGSHNWILNKWQLQTLSFLIATLN